MIVIGVDPGLDGAVARVTSDGKADCVLTPTMPHPSGKGNRREYDVPAMRTLLWDWRIQVISSENPDGKVLAILEQQQSMPGQGVSSMFSIGKGYGIWIGLLTGLSIPFEVVHPRRWSGKMLDGMPKGDTKAAAKLIAGRLYPNLDLKASPRCKGPHDGKCDSLLIATYGLRHVLGATSR